MPTRSIPAPGATLHVIDEGSPDAPAIVLLHAGIADSRAWVPVVPLLVAGGYRVVAFDRRGFGLSVTEDVEFSNRADVMAVFDALGIGRAALVGNSQGGQVAIDTAIEFAERIVAVVGVAAGLGGFDPGATDAEMAEFERMDELETRLDEAGPDGDPEALAAVLDLDVAFWVDGLGQSPDRVPAAIRDLVRTMDTDHYAPGRLQGQAVRLDPPAVGRLDELVQPVLGVAGRLDATDCVATVEHLAAHAPNATAVVWPDVAHMIGLEAPERLAGLILDFLAPLPRWS